MLHSRWDESTVCVHVSTTMNVREMRERWRSGKVSPHSNNTRQGRLGLGEGWPGQFWWEGPLLVFTLAQMRPGGADPCLWQARISEASSIDPSLGPVLDDWPLPNRKGKEIKII